MHAVSKLTENPSQQYLTATFRWEGAGPFAINVLEVNLAAGDVSLGTFKGGDRFEGRETTSALSARLAAQQPRPVYGAVNADFFTPTGALGA